MPFVLDPSESVQREVRRVTRERLDEALSTLDGLADAQPHEIERAVHEVRKRCKEVRSVARLVRSALGDDYVRFNSLVRDAADELAPIRDAHAILATFDDLRAATGEQDDGLGTVRDVQAAAARAATRGVLGRDPRIDRAHSLLQESRASVKHWKIPKGSGTVMRGLDDTYRRGKRDFQRALKRPTDRRVHEWRTSTKHLWYQTRLVEQAAPSVLGPMIDNLDDLAEALGDDHDLAVLIARLKSDPERFGGSASATLARRLARRQQHDLRRRAFRLAGTIYAEKPGAFVRRMSAYWECTAAEGIELPTGGIAELADDERIARHEPAARLGGMKQRTIVITGVARGLGRELASRFAANGHTVFGTTRSGEAPIELAGCVELELSDESSITEAISSLGDATDGIDILINCAGADARAFGANDDERGPFDLDMATFDKVFQVNVTGTMAVTREALPLLRRGTASMIVNISSQLGSMQVGARMGRDTAYNVSKAALNMLSLKTAAALKSDGIGVVMLHPGWVSTDLGGPTAQLSVEEAGSAIVDTIESLTIADTGRFVRWDGHDHPW